MMSIARRISALETAVTRAEEQDGTVDTSETMRELMADPETFRAALELARERMSKLRTRAADVRIYER